MDTIKFWWNLTRPHTLSASIMPVFVGTLYAIILTKTVSLPLFLAMFLACILIQIATNLFNEYYDFKTGLDDQNSVGISGVIVRGETTPDFILQLAIGLYVIAGGLGAFIAFKSSWIILGIGAYFMLLGYLY